MRYPLGIIVAWLEAPGAHLKVFGDLLRCRSFLDCPGGLSELCWDCVGTASARSDPPPHLPRSEPRPPHRAPSNNSAISDPGRAGGVQEGQSRAPGGPEEVDDLIQRCRFPMARVSMASTAHASRLRAPPIGLPTGTCNWTVPRKRRWPYDIRRPPDPI